MYKEIESSKKWDGLVILIFLIITFTITYPLWNSHQVFVANDWSFHASRVEEIYQNLKSGHLFTYIATHTFQKTGVANFLFYPTIFLYPWAIFRFLFSPVTAFYGWYALINFSTLIITYFCAKRIVGTQVKALLVALLYVLMPYHIFVGMGVFGEFIAMTFVPLVLLGGYELFFTDKKSWKLLAIGLSLVGYSHFLSVILCCEVLLLLFIISVFMKKWVDKGRWLALLKSVGTTIILMAGIIVTFLSNYVGQDITSTNVGINYTMVWSLKNFILASFSTYYNQTLGTILIITAFTGYITSSQKIVKVSWVLGVLLSLMITNIFPWESISKLIPLLGIIQFPYRYLTYAGIFLAIVAADVIGQLSEGYVQRGGKNWTILVVITLVAFFYPLATLFNGDWRKNPDYVNIESRNALGTVQGTNLSYRVGNNNYNQIFKHGVLYGEGDYYPSVARAGNSSAWFGYVVKNKTTRSIVDGITYADGKVIKATRISGANKLTYKLKNVKGKTINLPFLVYKNTYLEVGGKHTNYQVSKRGTIEFKATSNQVVATVGYKATILMKIGMLVTLISWLAIIASSVLKLRRAS